MDGRSSGTSVLSPWNSALRKKVMQTNKNVLVSVDASEASMRVMIYVAEMIGAHRQCRVYLFHVLPPIPPELLEFGGLKTRRRNGC